jgi:hydroxyethylthiazole kinase-like uncharacterized protein yjeF
MAQLPPGTLMQRAAAGLAARCLRLLGRVSGSRVVLLVGPGDNGGDTLHAGARLARRGARVQAVLVDPARAHPGGLAALRAAGGRVTDDAEAEIARAGLVLDGIVGIGGSPGLRPAAAALAQAATASRALVVAVDLPSGVAVDTGEAPAPHVQADVTVTFGTHKVCHLVDPAAAACGQVHLVDIGLDTTLPPASTHLVRREDAAQFLPRPGFADNKYTRGVVHIAAGSGKYPGAGQLCVLGARHSGAGMVRSPVAGFPDVVAAEGRTDAYVVGPGLADQTRLTQAVRTALDSGRPTVLDAEALAQLAPGPVVITPHTGEFARLGRDLGDDRIAAVRRTARELQVVVLLKGAVTVVAEPGGEVFLNAHSGPALAVAGSGDVLSGLLGGMLARHFAGREPDLVTMARLAACAALIHGEAGRRASFPATSVDIAGEVRAAVAWAAG